jgi:hypothetical protein
MFSNIKALFSIIWVYSCSLEVQLRIRNTFFYLNFKHIIFVGISGRNRSGSPLTRFSLFSFVKFFHDLVLNRRRSLFSVVESLREVMQHILFYFLKHHLFNKTSLKQFIQVAKSINNYNVYKHSSSSNKS